MVCHQWRYCGNSTVIIVIFYIYLHDMSDGNAK